MGVQRCDNVERCDRCGAQWGYRQGGRGYPEIFLHDTGGAQEWRNEYWFQGEEASVAFGVLIVDGEQGRNCFDFEASLVQVWTCDVNTYLDEDVWALPRSSATTARC